jgi:hypothetical protein
MFSEQRIEKDAKELAMTSHKFSWSDSGKPQKLSVSMIGNLTEIPKKELSECKPEALPFEAGFLVEGHGGEIKNKNTKIRKEE